LRPILNLTKIHPVDRLPMHRRPPAIGSPTFDFTFCENP